MGDQVAHKARIASVVAATGIALACGTNYAYSAWGPDFAKRMQLSATEANVIGASGNVGAYAMGVPAGILIDRRSPQLGVFVGAVALAAGYFPIHKAYDAGPGSYSIGLLSFCSFLTGLGSCTAFSAAIKTATYNWPDNRGTATAFPLSGFGLSAFFFTGIAHVFFSEDISSFLLLLAAGTLVLNGISFFFLRLIPSTPQASGGHALQKSHSPNRGLGHNGSAVASGATGESDALVSRTSTGDTSDSVRDEFDKHVAEPPVQLEITGIRLLGQFEFWQLFGILGLLAGVGLMTINNIGNNAGLLWLHYDPKATPAFVQSREQMHVGILSIGSCAGRFLSGTGSDYLTKKLHASRFWCLVISALGFVVAQLLALVISTPTFLFLVSGLTGLAYGALFGVFPALVADKFGVHGLSLNWGFMIFAPVLTGNVFNLMYGRILDANTPPPGLGDGVEAPTDGVCTKGISCYVAAYWITLASSCLGVFLALWCIRYAALKRRKGLHGREA